MSVTDRTGPVAAAPTVPGDGFDTDRKVGKEHDLVGRNLHAELALGNIEIRRGLVGTFDGRLEVELGQLLCLERGADCPFAFLVGRCRRRVGQPYAFVGQCKVALSRFDCQRTFVLCLATPCLGQFKPGIRGNAGGFRLPGVQRNQRLVGGLLGDVGRRGCVGLRRPGPLVLDGKRLAGLFSFHQPALIVGAGGTFECRRRVGLMGDGSGGGDPLPGGFYGGLRRHAGPYGIGQVPFEGPHRGDLRRRGTERLEIPSTCKAVRPPRRSAGRRRHRRTRDQNRDAAVPP